jgi:hypothetical protein
VLALCRYRGVEPTINRELLDAACASYFVHNELAPTLAAGPTGAGAAAVGVH